VKCADVLSQVYVAGVYNVDVEVARGPINVPPFLFREVSQALRNMSKGRAGDKDGVLTELFLHGGDVAVQCLTNFFNQILESGEVPAKWFETHFILLHKGGPTDDVNNWRPIAILAAAYKVLARAIFERIRRKLDACQSDEQFGFRAGRSTTSALLIIEHVISKCVEWQVPCWVISIDLRKAFDRVEQEVLFGALAEHGVEDGYVDLLRRLYQCQSGHLNDGSSFEITRGVRQGDVLSPVLFNTAL
jgi:hypothetical protein